MYVVYLDVLFTINLYMNLIILSISSLILNSALKKKKWFCAGLQITVFYCISLLVPGLQKLPTLAVVLILPTGSLLYLYRPTHLKEFLKVYVVHFLAAFLLGGTSFGIWNILGYSKWGHKMGAYYIIGIATIVYILFYISFYSIRMRLILPHFEYDIQLIRGNQNLQLKAFLDTGNTLYTPISHKAVIIVTYEAVKGLLTEEEELFFNRKETEDVVRDGLERGWKLIPFNSMGCSEGVLLGIACDELVIFRGGLSQSFSGCIAGISKVNLFKNQHYQALLHPEFIVNRGTNHGNVKGFCGQNMEADKGNSL